MMKSRFIYWLVYSGMWLFSALPFRMLYILSDFNYLLMYRIGRYRRKVVRENLKKSFPEKSKEERLQIERRFYRYLSDYMLEDLKMLHMSPEDLYQRMTYKNTEQYLELTEKYGGIIVMIPHYANYEWLIGMGASTASKSVKKTTNTAAKKAAKKTIKVGDYVKPTGSRYATGQKIPNWVKQRKHRVSQIKSNQNKVLLGHPNGINSWVYLSEVTLA